MASATSASVRGGAASRSSRLSRASSLAPIGLPSRPGVQLLAEQGGVLELVQLSRGRCGQLLAGQAFPEDLIQHLIRRLVQRPAAQPAPRGLRGPETLLFQNFLKTKLDDR